MTIIRIDTQDHWSEAVVYNNVIYYMSVPSNLINAAYQQTKSALDEIDKMLASTNSNKSHILDATLFLINKSDFAAMN